MSTGVIFILGKGGSPILASGVKSTWPQGSSAPGFSTIAELVTANTIYTTKEVLTSDEAAQYMGISKSYLYKLTMRGEIPHYKPMGKMCYFNRAELEEWLQSNRVATATEIADRANQYCMKRK